MKLQTNYLGSKQRLLPWLLECIPTRGVHSFFDAFSGSGCVGYEYKRRGLKIISNDILRCCYHAAVALIENNHVRLSSDDIISLLKPNPKKKRFIEENFQDVFFIYEDNQFLDTVLANINGLKDRFKQSIALYSLCRTCQKKQDHSHFTTTRSKYKREKVYRKDPKAKTTLAAPISELFVDMVLKVNSAVFGNGQENRAYNMDILDLASRVQADLIYMDPPYVGCVSDYQHKYHFLEGLCTHWNNGSAILTGKIKTYHSPYSTAFSNIKNIEKSFEKLFERIQHIPIWILSYNNKAKPTKQSLKEKMAKHRRIEIVQKPYDYVVQGKDTACIEYLFIGT